MTVMNEILQIRITTEQKRRIKDEAHSKGYNNKELSKFVRDTIFKKDNFTQEVILKKIYEEVKGLNRKKEV